MRTRLHHERRQPQWAGQADMAGAAASQDPIRPWLVFPVFVSSEEEATPRKDGLTHFAERELCFACQSELCAFGHLHKWTHGKEQIYIQFRVRVFMQESWLQQQVYGKLVSLKKHWFIVFNLTFAISSSDWTAEKLRAFFFHSLFATPYLLPRLLWVFLCIYLNELKWLWLFFS